ncbi:hypothetical protein ACPCSP_30790 [Streptomyces cinereoruber]|uniref:hypothetical protein n=1 Tax=Streptomyces cinereoruber TaxID=67260 RepID=UPI003C2F1BC0
MDMLKDFVMPVITALLAWWLTSVTHKRVARAAATAGLESQADSLLVSVSQLRASAAAGRVLWDSPAERGRTFLLAALHAAGGAAVTHMAGRSDRLSSLAGLGQAARFLAEERRHGKAASASVLPQSAAILASAAPLLRHEDPAVAAGAQGILDAIGDIENDEQLDRALRTFNDAVRAALQPRRRWWHRRRSA